MNKVVLTEQRFFGCVIEGQKELVHPKFLLCTVGCIMVSLTVQEFIWEKQGGQ